MIGKLFPHQIYSTCRLSRYSIVLYCLAAFNAPVSANDNVSKDVNTHEPLPINTQTPIKTSPLQEKSKGKEQIPQVTQKSNRKKTKGKEDVFIPSEEISKDLSVSFPTDI